MIPARILGTGSLLAGRRMTTGELVARALPGKDPAAIEERIGIATRLWLEPGTDAAATGAKALAGALEMAGLEARALRRIVFVSSTGGDHLIPATANAVAEKLGLDDTCDGFDVNNACTGFLSAFDLAARSVATGLGPVAIVAAETFSRYLPPDRPRPYLVLGDAAAAVVLGEARRGEGVVASHLRNSSALRGRVTMAHPGRTGAPPFLDFQASYDELTDSAFEAIAKSARAACAEAGLGLAEVEWFLPHQPNGRMLERVVDGLGVPRERIVSVVEEIGSVGAASVPVSLDRLLRTRAVRPGDRLLLSAVGAGTGYGSILYRVAP
jgi:3-oxoacyl-(acyl-carrier-protein) synthase III